MLVSVVVVTYNSADFVLETLDSIAAQTYPELELIITDDCSKDDTVAVCRNWLDQHKERFVRTELLTVEKNTGIAGNCNRGYEAAQGEWIKNIAGDDIMLPECIEKGVEFGNQNKCRIFTVALQEFGIRHNKKMPPQSWRDADAKKQLDIALTEGPFMAAPGMFCQKRLWQECGKYDERFPMLEDLPFFIKVLLSGEKIYASNELLVKYRVYNTSTCRSKTMDNSLYEFQKTIMIPLQREHHHYFYAYHNRVLLWRSKFKYKNMIIRKMVSLVLVCFDPLLLIVYLKIFCSLFQKKHD